MVSVTLHNGITWYMHPLFKQNLDILLQDVKDNRMDLVIVIDGAEGIGKSFKSWGLGMYCATKLNSTFTVDNISWNIEDYISKSLKAGRAADTGKHHINVLDEGRHAIHRARGGHSKNLRFTNYLSECRDMGQVHIIIAPAFHDIDKYVILWRMNMLIHAVKNYEPSKKTETGVKLKRGEFKVFLNNAPGKKALSTCWEMKNYTYPHKWEIHAWWPSVCVLTEEQVKQYEKRKFSATMDKYFKEEEEKEQAEADEKELNNTKQEYTKATIFAKKLGLSRLGVIKAIKEGRLKGRKQLGLWYVESWQIEKCPENTADAKQQAEIALKMQQSAPFNPNNPKNIIGKKKAEIN